MHRILRYSTAPSAAYVFSNVFYQYLNPNSERSKLTFCDANVNVNQNPTHSKLEDSSLHHVQRPPENKHTSDLSNGKAERNEELYYDMFPLRQLYKPKVEYPLWDSDWDNRKPASTGDKKQDYERMKYIRKNGITRHIILIRHGQYDETYKQDEKRLLTPLGRKQATLTGQRIAEMIRGFDKEFGPCNVTTLRVSDLTRAKETAEIIAEHLPKSVIRAAPDPLLNEGRPCHHIPSGKMTSKIIQQTDEGHERIEKAFHTYFYRSEEPASSIETEDQVASPEDELKSDPLHEFEIIVCHANVIRYFICRALQIPPEAWLRLCTFNCSLNYITIRPTGSVSIRMLGDIGHLGYDHSTFSMHHGFNW
jgi:serine/threonine-protein phosphatase PGAM5